MASDSRISEPEQRRSGDDPQRERETAKPVPQGKRAPATTRSAKAAEPVAETATPQPPPETNGESDAANAPASSLNVESRFLLFAAIPSWLVSMVFHVVVLVILALITLPEKSEIRRILTLSEVDRDAEEFEELEEPIIEPVDLPEFAMETPLALSSLEMAEESVPEFQDLEAAPQTVKLTDFGEKTAPKDNLLAVVGAATGTGLDGRGAEARGEMIERFGGSKGSEAAVAMALAWLAEHQERDGGWNFDHQRGPSCRGQCSHSGMIASSRNGATAMALLPFLGAGQTHKEGKYKDTVERGLYYLLRNMKVSNGRGDLSDPGGRLYSHGMCAIALCEAYAMTNDPQLMQPAQLALNYIVYAQDPVGGGWRYQPKMPGDTSVVGWQLMALKSGHMAYLNVPKETITKATKFLDSVQVESGSKYGYTAPAGRASTTSVGLLCRMYLGWKKEEPGLARGVEFLGELGPTNNMYYNYYATQVMRHFEGEPWEKWNSQIRDSLVEAQDKRGHRKGSWYFADAPHGDRGGRLYCTSMATMILEVYYRHMPIYGKQAAEEDFPL